MSLDKIPMRFTFFSESTEAALKSAGNLFFILLIKFLGILLFYFYIKTGHYADREFVVVSLVEFISGIALSLFFPEKQFFFASFGALTLPRITSIYSGKSSHNTLFPFFLGLSVGMILRSFYKGIQRHELPLFKINPAIIFLTTFVLILIFRAFCDYYSPYVLLGYPLQDLEVGPGVSSNYAFHLSLTIALNILAPGLFLLSAFGEEYETKKGRVEQIFHGFLFSICLNLIVVAGQLFGIIRLYAGSAYSLEANRVPGLFSDSGASSAIFPLLFYFLYIYFSQKIVNLKKGYISDNFRHYFLMAFFLAAVVFFGKTQGRGYYLTLLIPLILAFLHLKNSIENSKKKSEFIFYFLFIVIVSFALFLLIKLGRFPAFDRHSIEFSKLYTHYSNGNIKNIFEAFDFGRTHLFLAGWEIIKEYPWLGSGLNSFMVETARLRQFDPTIPVDSSVNFYLGILGDTGIIGVIFIFIFCVYYAAEIIAALKENQHPVFLFILMLPIYLAVPFLYGYHIIHPEVCVLLLFPYLLLSRKASETKGVVIIKRAGKIGLLIFLLVSLFDFYLQIKAESPSYWRTNRAVLPQLHPDFKESFKDSGSLFLFRKERNFAMASERSNFGEDGLITIFLPEKQDLYVACKTNSSAYETLNFKRKLDAEVVVLSGINYVQNLISVPALCLKTVEAEIQIRLLKREEIKLFGVNSNLFYKNRLIVELPENKSANLSLESN